LDATAQDRAVPPQAVLPIDGTGPDSTSTHIRFDRPLVFQSLQPCRFVDTREVSPSGGYGGPKLAAGSTRSFNLRAVQGFCGFRIPAGAQAVAINATIVDPDSAGHATLFPSGTAQPTASSINASSANDVVANAMIVPLGDDGSINIYAFMGTHIVVDVTGYFLSDFEGGNNLKLRGANHPDFPFDPHSVGGVLEVENLSAGPNGFGILGSAQASPIAQGLSAGIRGISSGSFQGGTGVWGSNGGNGIGVYGEAPSGVGVSGRSSNGTGVQGTGRYGGYFSGVDANSTAGYFAGNVTVTGTLSKGAGSFKIDHPDDPANKYLSHSFVESPDMMNVYNGIVTTDVKGRAIVQMPEYFASLNRDFRYQLTVLSKHFAQVVIEEELAGTKFVIKSSRPNVKVSWQVTGIRHDAFANAHRIAVEEAKQGAERGAFLNPELFNQPPEKGINFVRKKIIEAVDSSEQTASARGH
jgi:hypothetical protein